MLFFLHGFLGSAATWHPYIEHFSKQYTTLAIDLPGHREAPLLGIKEIKESIPRGATLIGYSMGGRIALSLITSYPHLYHSAIIFSAHPGLESKEAISQREEEEKRLIHSLEHEPLETFVKTWYQNPLFGGLSPPPLAFEHKKEGLIHALKTFSITRQENLWPRLTTCPKPLSFLFGELDPKYAPLAKRIPGAKLIKNAAHSVLLQNREESIGAIETHLQTWSHSC